MKKVSLLLTVVIIASMAITFSSCKKKYEPSMTCKVDGEEYSSLIRLNYRGGMSDFDNKEVFLLNGSDNLLISSGKYLSILIGGTETKTFNLSTQSIFTAAAGCTAVWSPGGQSSAEDTSAAGRYTANGGTVEITAVDEDEKRISGTFSFELLDPKDLTAAKISITEGQFTDVKYSNVSVGTALLSAFL